MPKFFTKYTPPKIPGFSSDQPSKVQEQFADACQTDTIIRKYNLMGVNPFIATGGSQYLDTTQIPSFVAAQNAQLKLRNIFRVYPLISVLNLITTRWSLLRSSQTRAMRITSERSEFLNPSLLIRRVKNPPLSKGIISKKPPTLVKVVNFLLRKRLKSLFLLKNQMVNSHLAQSSTCCNCAR